MAAFGSVITMLYTIIDWLVRNHRLHAAHQLDTFSFFPFTIGQA
jgi:hypothetical protein